MKCHDFTPNGAELHVYLKQGYIQRREEEEEADEEEEEEEAVDEEKEWGGPFAAQSVQSSYTGCL